MLELCIDKAKDFLLSKAIKVNLASLIPTKHCLTWQRKELYNYFKTHKLYKWFEFERNKYRFSKIREKVELGEFMPIWVFHPEVVDYAGRGMLFNNHNIISQRDIQQGFMNDLLFHISLCPVDKEDLDEFFSKHYLYEISVPATAIYDDTSEGYTICGCIPHIWKHNIVGVYEVSTIDSNEEMFYKYPLININPIFLRDKTALCQKSFKAYTVQEPIDEGVEEPEIQLQKYS